MEHEIYVSREKKNLGHRNAAALIKKAVNMALDAEQIPVPCLISVMLTDDTGIRAVNLAQRGIDAPTDVLSFPMNELEEGAFFLADIMGLEVWDADTGEVLGQIADILTPPASNVYVVKGGAAEHMIPAVPEFIVETNVDEGFIRVRLIEGM